MESIIVVIKKIQFEDSIISLWLIDFLKQLYEHKDIYRERIVIPSNESFEKLSINTINAFIEVNTVMMDYIIELTNLTLIYNMDSYIQEYRKIVLSIYHYSTYSLEHEKKIESILGITKSDLENALSYKIENIKI
jgi:hypothetical protein